MDIGEIIMDALSYPLHNVKALVIYVILGIIAAFAAGGTAVGVMSLQSINNFAAASGVSIIGLIICFIIYLLIYGYVLDIVKLGVNRSDDAPSIEIGRQVVNAIKLIIVAIVYYIIPIIIAVLLAFLLGSGILTLLITLILFIIFTFAFLMGVCRLAKSDSLGEALAFGEAIGDISKIGFVKILAVIIIIIIISAILSAIGSALLNVNFYLGAIVSGIINIYLIFFSTRATGLLYSDA